VVIGATRNQRNTMIIAAIDDTIIENATSTKPDQIEHNTGSARARRRRLHRPSASTASAVRDRRRCQAQRPHRDPATRGDHGARTCSRRSHLACILSVSAVPHAQWLHIASPIRPPTLHTVYGNWKRAREERQQSGGRPAEGKR
jgi:hypothetical protein